MNSLFFALGVASLIGSVVFLILLVLKPFTKKLFSTSWHYYMGFVPVFFFLGGVAAVNMLVEFVGKQFSALSARLNTSTIATAVDSNEGLPHVNAATPLDNLHYIDSGWTPPFNILPEIAPQNHLGNLPNLLDTEHIMAIGIFLTAVWAIGAVLTVTINVKRYMSFRYAILKHSWVCTSVQSHVNVIISSVATTPMVIGFLKPFIVLPDVELSNHEQNMILSHELVHYRRKDVWLKVVILMARAIHWFNPAVYYLARHIDTLCELSCDEEVVMEMNKQERRLYGETILSMLQHSNVQRYLFCASGLCNSKKNIKRRLLNMLNTKKTRKSMVALSLAATFAITGFSTVAAYGIGRTAPSDNAAPSIYVPSIYVHSIETSVETRSDVIRGAETHSGTVVRVVGPVHNGETGSSFIMINDDGVSVIRGHSFTWNSLTEFFDTFTDWDSVDGDVSRAYVRTIMNTELADQLWANPNFTELRSRTGLFALNFVTSDQFLQFIDIFGEEFVVDFLTRDVSEVLETVENLFGDVLANFIEASEREMLERSERLDEINRIASNNFTLSEEDALILMDDEGTLTWREARQLYLRTEFPDWEELYMEQRTLIEGRDSARFQLEQSIVNFLAELAE